MKVIGLTQNKVTKVSDEDAYSLSLYKWHLCNGYAARRLRGKTRSLVYMHRQIVGCPPDMEVDHINGDRLDNRRENLRVCSHQQNMVNWDNRRGASRYRGVSKDPERPGWWKVQIMRSGRNMRVGRYRSEEEAALAYDAAAIELFGEFAQLNFKEAV